MTNSLGPNYQWNDLLDKISNINLWKRGGRIAPHKPLLLLLCLSGFYKLNQRRWYFKDIGGELYDLLVLYGPSSQTYHPEYPFVRLSNDGIWDVSTQKPIDSRKDYSGSTLRAIGASGAFTRVAAKLLEENFQKIPDLISLILENNFPQTIHEEILNQVGFDEVDLGSKRRREPEFRRNVLMAYEYRCAVCGISPRIIDNLVGIEAAHIRWHTAHGPDEVINGISMCSMHHKIFDRGGFTVTPEYNILVSKKIHGGQELNRILFDFHGGKIQLPTDPNEHPLNVSMRPSTSCSGSRSWLSSAQKKAC